jgi:hypothetical protein
MQSLRFSGSKGKLPLRLLSALAVTSSMLAGFSVMNAAQSSEGLILFGGVKSENRLSYTFDFGGEPNTIDRGRFRIPAKKMNLAAAQFAVSYPDYYEGTFNPKKEARLLEIFPEEPVPAGKEVELVISDMRTPRFGGMYHFNCQILAPGDVPLLRYVGTWLLSIS